MELLIGGNWGFLEEASCRGDPNLICHRGRKLPAAVLPPPELLLMLYCEKLGERCKKWGRLHKSSPSSTETITSAARSDRQSGHVTGSATILHSVVASSVFFS